MTVNQIKIKYLVKKLRWLWKDDEKKMAELDKLLWFSYPVVYPDWENDDHQILAQMAKRKAAKRRANKYIKNMFACYDDLKFVTLTWDDDTLLKTKELTRHQYVKRWLEENTRDYIANVDWGAKNGREHYHAVVALTKDGLKDWKYGFYNIKTIQKFTDQNVYQLNNYILKLSNHAGKINCGKIFHKRGLKDIDELPF